MDFKNKSKKLGQFFTPKVIADFMIELITKDKESAILEPCAGQGIFLRRLKKKTIKILMLMKLIIV